MKHIIWILILAGLAACGLPGADGKDGVANIEAFEMNFPTNFIALDSHRSKADIIVDELTQEVANYGTVLAFSLVEGMWQALPDVYAFGNGRTVTLNYAYSPYTFRVVVEDTQPDVHAASIAIFADTRIKFVLIPPAEMDQLDRIDTGNYESVMNLLQPVL